MKKFECTGMTNSHLLINPMRKYHVAHTPGTRRMYYCGCDARGALQELLKERVGAMYRPKLKLDCKRPEADWNSR